MKLNPNIRNVLATGVITGVFAFSFSIGGVSAFAEGATDSQNASTVETQTTVTSPDAQTTQDTAETQNNTSTAGSGASSVQTSDSQTTATNTDMADTQESTKAPSLLPGDFFYFVKTVTEKIQLALTFDDKDKAMKLAEFAQERLAEAQALIEEGKTDLAKETIDEALKQQEAAEKTAENLAQNTSADDLQNQNPNDTSAAADNGSSTLTSQLQAKFGHNILALQSSLAKVDNPKAQAALTRNIERAQEHVSKMLAKKHADVHDEKNEDEQTSITDSVPQQVETKADQDQTRIKQAKTEEQRKTETVESKQAQPLKSQVKQTNQRVQQAEIKTTTVQQTTITKPAQQIVQKRVEQKVPQQEQPSKANTATKNQAINVHQSENNNVNHSKQENAQQGNSGNKEHGK